MPGHFGVVLLLYMAVSWHVACHAAVLVAHSPCRLCEHSMMQGFCLCFECSGFVTLFAVENDVYVKPGHVCQADAAAAVPPVDTFFNPVCAAKQLQQPSVA